MCVMVVGSVCDCSTFQHQMCVYAHNFNHCISLALLSVSLLDEQVSSPEG